MFKDFFSILPQPLAPIILVVAAVILVIDFFKAPIIERMFENRRRKIIRNLFNEVMIFFVSTVFIFIISKEVYPYGIFSISIQVLTGITFGFFFFAINYPYCRLQMTINKLLAKISLKLVHYKLILAALNVIFIYTYYWFVIGSIAYILNSGYKTGKSKTSDIVSAVFKAHSQEILSCIIILLVLYLIIRTCLEPTMKFFRAKLSVNYRVDVKLSNGEVISDKYLISAIDKNLIIVSNNSKLGNFEDCIVINRDKVDYISVKDSKKSMLKDF